MLLHFLSVLPLPNDFRKPFSSRWLLLIFSVKPSMISSVQRTQKTGNSQKKCLPDRLACEPGWSNWFKSALRWALCFSWSHFFLWIFESSIFCLSLPLMVEDSFRRHWSLVFHFLHKKSKHSKKLSRHFTRSECYCWLLFRSWSHFMIFLSSNTMPYFLSSRLFSVLSLLWIQISLPIWSDFSFSSFE